MYIYEKRQAKIVQIALEVWKSTGSYAKFEKETGSCIILAKTVARPHPTMTPSYHSTLF